MLLTTAASGARRPFPGKVITPGGIGQLRLGMSAKTAQRLLRRVATPYPVREVSLRPGVKYVEFEYRRDPYAADYIAGFLGRPGQRRLVMIGTFRKRERTREGIRVGATGRTVRRAYGGRLNCELLGRQGHACTLGTSARRNITLVLGGTVIVMGNEDVSDTVPNVTRILVRERGLRVSIV